MLVSKLLDISLLYSLIPGYCIIHRNAYFDIKYWIKSQGDSTCVLYGK